MEAFLSCDEELKNAEFNVYNSGTTCNLIIHIGWKSYYMQLGIWIDTLCYSGEHHSFFV